MEDESIVANVIRHVRSKANGDPVDGQISVTINFHPDRYTIDGKPILCEMAKSQYLKSQFQTGTSNGSISAYPGGARWSWESKAFDSLYDNVDEKYRPKYGALNYQNRPEGASPRFGSAFFKLKTNVLDRTTFCFPDSYFGPDNFATYDSVSALIEMSINSKLDYLDNYIEAQIHGDLSFRKDVESLVLDPIFRGTEIEEYARQLPVTLDWHRGFKMPVTIAQQQPDYRGAHIVKIAIDLAKDGNLNCLVLGAALKEGLYDPQDIKKAWHYLARFGAQTQNA